MKITDYLDNFMLHGIPIIALATIPVLYSKNPTYKDAIIGPAAYITGFCISKIHDKYRNKNNLEKKCDGTKSR